MHLIITVTGTSHIMASSYTYLGGIRQQLAHEKSKGVCPSYLLDMVEDNQRVKGLELKLRDVAEVRDLDTKFKAVKRVGEWQLDQLKLMDPMTNKGVKRADEWRRDQLFLIDAEKAKQVMKLHNMERDQWIAERDKLRVERENWKLISTQLKCEAFFREQQLKKLTLESHKWKAELIKLTMVESEHKDVVEKYSNLLEQLQIDHTNLDVQRSTGEWQEVSNSQTPTIDLKSPSIGTCRQQAQNDRENWTGYYSRPEVKDCVSPQQRQQKLKTAISQGEKLEEVCKDLLFELERRNSEIWCNQVNLAKASRCQALMQLEVNVYKEEIKRLKKTEVSECIICMNEFGEDLDQQRAHWKDCNHANICYSCTKTLWNSNKRNCPTCKTPASSIPSRLPPKIYL